jgi:Trk-type K+ transport system membrane component
MIAGLTSSPSVSISDLNIAVTVDKPLAVFEMVSAYGTVGLSLGLPTVGLLYIMDFGIS